MKRFRFVGSAVTLVLASATLVSIAPAAQAAPDVGTPAASSAVAARAGSTAIPTAVGPLPVTATSYPFGAADHQGVPENLAAVGYTEKEYLVSGRSNVYTWTPAGPGAVRTADAPYTTRVLVRLPAAKKTFSGNVVVEMLNPSNYFDLNIGWAVAHRQMVKNGDAWVGITAKPIAVDALKNFDPARYAALSFANPLALNDPANCLTVAADSARTTENGLIWDIYTQVGAWLKSASDTNPLRYGTAKSRVQHAYGFGYSQTGGYLVNYINAIHPLVVKADGRPMYDAYIVAVAGGAFAGAYPLNQCEPAPLPTDARRQISNVGVPVMRIMSQSDYLYGIDSRRPDSDSPRDRYRHYEMAGAGHATPDELYFSASPADIVRANRTVPPAACTEGPRSRFPSAIFFNAALRNLDWWVRYNVAPPHADPILVKDGAPVLDQFGNVQGGLRSTLLEVPTSTWYGTATGASFCFIAGYEVPLDKETLAREYSSHLDYTKQVGREALSLVAQRFLTTDDARLLVTEAAKSNIP